MLKLYRYLEIIPIAFATALLQSIFWIGLLVFSPFALDIVMALAYKALTLNCSSLNNSIKAKCLSNWLKKEHTNVLFLQETHQKRNNITLLKSKWFEHQYYAGGSSKSRGVAIALSKGMQIQTPDILWDPRGRYIFIKCKLDDVPYTLASIYAPNSHQIEFLKSTFAILSTFCVGELLIGGDFNLVPDASLDRAGGLRRRKQATHNKHHSGSS